MNSDDLELFARVVKAGSLSRAGLELGTDPSTVSRRIAQLEGELGMRLLHRSGRGVSATEQGRQLLAYAEKVAGLLAEAVDAIRDPAVDGPARLHIGAQPTIAQTLFGTLARGLQAQYPRTRLRLVEALGSQILDKLASGELDFAIMYLPEQPGPLQFDLLLSEGLHLIVPPDMDLPGDSLPLARLGELPLILPSTPHGIRLMVETQAVRHGFKPRIAIECDASMALTKRLVMEGRGCTLLPLAAVGEEQDAGRLRTVRLTSPGLRRRIGLVTGRNRAIPAGLWKIIGRVKTEVEALVVSGAWPDTRLDATPPRAAGEVAGDAAVA